MDDILEGGWSRAGPREIWEDDPMVISRRGMNRRLWFAVLLVFAGYYLGARLGFALTFKPHAVSVLWPPNSILLAALLLVPPGGWWPILLAAFPAHCLAELESNVPAGMVFCWFISNCVEALIGASTIRYLTEGHLRLNCLRHLAAFCLGGVFLAPFLSSFLDLAFVALNHWGGDSYWEGWRIRFSSNALAALTLTPLILSWAGQGLVAGRKLSRMDLGEAAGLFLSLLLIAYLIFNKLPLGTDPALLYAPLPLLLWAAIRYGLRGATTATAIVALFAIWGAAHGHGPFTEASERESAFYVQLFLSFMALPLLFLAALTEERKQTEQTLQEREERISLASETAKIGLWTIDFERGKSWMNDKGRELFGFSPNEPLSREVFLSCVHPEDRERVDRAIARARSESQTFEIEYRLLRPDGEVRWLFSRGRYLTNDRGETSQLLGVAIDVTGQVEANLELRARQEELARLSRVAVMGELTASLAHELNQPLTAIASNAAAGRRFLAGGQVDPAMFEELLTDVFADARRAGAIIHGIRHFVRKGQETRCSLSLNDVVGNVLQLLHSDLVGRATSIETELETALPAVQADLVQMQQVLINLLVNSLEAMEDLPPDRRRIEITTRTANGAVDVTVRDFGSGLPADDPDKIFTHFFSTKPEGMGMGLAIARSIIEAHGGELAAQNLSDGACLRFSLPRERNDLP